MCCFFIGLGHVSQVDGSKVGDECGGGEDVRVVEKVYRLPLILKPFVGGVFDVDTVGQGWRLEVFEWQSGRAFCKICLSGQGKTTQWGKKILTYDTDET
jgi:hypothetical protein